MKQPVAPENIYVCAHVACVPDEAINADSEVVVVAQVADELDGALHADQHPVFPNLGNRSTRSAERESARAGGAGRRRKVTRDEKGRRKGSVA